MDNNQCTKVADFLITYGDGLFIPEVRTSLVEAIKKHMGYGTLLVVFDKDEIVSVIRWNQNGDEAHVLDAAVHPDYRGKGVFERSVICALKANDWCKKIRFDNKTYTKEFKLEADYFLNKEQSHDER